MMSSQQQLFKGYQADILAARWYSIIHSTLMLIYLVKLKTAKRPYLLKGL